MAVHCGKCGEELLGAVNRCWKCGTVYQPQSGGASLPPVRRDPVEAAPQSAAPPADAPPDDARPADSPPADTRPGDFAGTVDREEAGVSNGSSADSSAASTPSEKTTVNEDTLVLEDGVPGKAARASDAADLPPVRVAPSDGASASGPGAAASAEPSEPRQGSPFNSDSAATNSQAETPVRVGSPFATTEASPAAAVHYGRAPAPDYPRHVAAVGGAVSCVFLGVMALAVSLSFTNLPPVGLILSFLGIGMGVWGLYSTRRTLAVIGLALCVAALTTSGFYSVVRLYEMIHGVSPFATDFDDGDEEDDGGPIDF